MGGRHRPEQPDRRLPGPAQPSTTGAWGSTVTVPATTRSATYSLTFDPVYRFRVRAVDRAGHWSPWAVAWTSRVHPYDDRSSRLVRTGAWTPATSSAAFKTTETGSSKATSAIGLTFSGHSVAVVGPKTPRRGKVQVFIDGVYVKTISMKSSQSLSRQIVFGWVFPEGGTHSISLVPTRDRYLQAVQARRHRRGALTSVRAVACAPAVS